MQDEGSCGAGQMYCWMSCMSTASLACSPSSMVRTLCICVKGIRFLQLAYVYVCV